MRKERLTNLTKEKKMEKIINLESVGCAFNTLTGMVSPLCSNGEIDFVNLV